MLVDVYALPSHALSVQSFSKRGEPAYLEAHEELRAAVATAMAEAGQVPETPYARCILTVICFTGKKRSDGYYRPERVPMLHYVIDPIYRALLDAPVVTDGSAFYEIRTRIERNSPREGFRIVVNELTPRPEPAQREVSEARA